MERLEADTLVSRDPETISGIIDDDMVTADIDSGNYRHLNRTGTRIWELIEAPRTVAEICLLLSREFRVTPDACLGSVRDFLNALAERHMISCQPGPRQAAGQANT